MQLKSIVSALLLALSVTACSTAQRFVYRIDVPQGNYLEADRVAQVKVGMTYQQVQYLLGTPLLTDPYGQNILYYVFLEQKSYEEPVQHTFTVHLNDKNIVTEVHLDRPLPENSQDSINNDIITEKQPEQKSSWWQFWK